MAFPVTGPYAALALIMVAPQISTIVARARTEILFGDGVDRRLPLPMRGHGDLTETVPVVLNITAPAVALGLGAGGLRGAGGRHPARAGRDRIAADLARYQRLHAVRPALLARAGQNDAAAFLCACAVRDRGGAGFSSQLQKLPWHGRAEPPRMRGAWAKKKAETKLGPSPTGR